MHITARINGNGYRKNENIQNIEWGKEGKNMDNNNNSNRNNDGRRQNEKLCSEIDQK